MYFVHIISATRLQMVLIIIYSQNKQKKHTAICQPKTDIDVPSGFCHFAYKQAAITEYQSLICMP